MIELLRNITEALKDKNIPYMVSGSIAMLTYTTARMTRDIDIIVDLRLADLEKFVVIFKEGYYIHEDSIREAIKQTGMFNIIDYKSGYKVDFVVKKRNTYREVEFSRRRKAFIQDTEVWIVCIEDLIISKLIWVQDYQSDRQIEDIRGLLKNQTIDWEYLKLWIQQLKLETYNLL